MTTDIADGKYKARATNWELGKTKKGAEQIAITFTLTDGRAITYYGYFSDAAYEYTVKNLRACGWRGSDLSALDTLSQNEVELVCRAEEYDGKTRQRVQFINGPDGMGLKEKLSDAETRSFAARMKSKIESLGSVPRSGPAPNDLPF